MRIDNQKVCVPDEKQEQKGSHFLVGVEYVDYTTPENGETLTDVTQELLKRKFVVFDREVKVM